MSRPGRHGSSDELQKVLDEQVKRNLFEIAKHYPNAPPSQSVQETEGEGAEIDQSLAD